MEPLKYSIEVNEELEGYDIIERDSIETEEGNGDRVMATFYEKDEAYVFVNILNMQHAQNLMKEEEKRSEK